MLAHAGQNWDVGWVIWGSGFLDLVLACWGVGLFHYMAGYSFEVSHG